MLTQVFKTVLILSAVGSVLTVLFTLLRPITKKYFTAQWNYYIWCAVLAVMVLPVSIPTSDVITHDTAVVYNDFAANAEYAADVISFDRNGAMAVAGIIWLTVTVLIAFVKIVSYIGFAELLLKNSIFEGSESGVRIYSTDIVDAPLVIGIFRSRLFIPIKKPQKDELDYIMAHELKLTQTDRQKEPVTVIVSHADGSKGDETYIYGGEFVEEEFVEEVEKNVPSSMTVTRASQENAIADFEQQKE